MIGLFNDCFPPIMDGVSVATKNYAYWLHRRGNEVCVITPSSSFPFPNKDTEEFPIYRYVSLPIPMRKPYRWGFPRVDWPFHRQLYDVPFSLVHAHCPFSSGLLAMRIARSRHIPAIATFHSKYRADFERVIPNKRIIDMLIAQIIRFYEHADEVWIPQASVEPTLREYGYKGAVEVVDNGNDFAGTFSQAARNAARTELGLQPGENFFVFVGQHIWEKNLAFLMQALARLNSSAFPFRMAFAGTGYAENDMKKMVESLGISDKVKFFGSITDRQRLRQIYLASDLFLFPSLYDNAPLVVREAAALHSPSLLIKGSTAAAIIRDGENGFLSANSVDAYADAIRRICENRPLLDTVATGAAHSLARSWEDIAAEVELRYTDLIRRYNHKTA